MKDIDLSRDSLPGVCLYVRIQFLLGEISHLGIRMLNNPFSLGRFNLSQIIQNCIRGIGTCAAYGNIMDGYGYSEHAKKTQADGHNQIRPFDAPSQVHIDIKPHTQIGCGISPALLPDGKRKSERIFMDSPFDSVGFPAYFFSS
jgi:hypothetical protein